MGDCGAGACAQIIASTTMHRLTERSGKGHRCTRRTVQNRNENTSKSAQSPTKKLPTDMCLQGAYIKRVRICTKAYAQKVEMPGVEPGSEWPLVSSLYLHSGSILGCRTYPGAGPPGQGRAKADQVSPIDMQPVYRATILPNMMSQASRQTNLQETDGALRRHRVRVIVRIYKFLTRLTSILGSSEGQPAARLPPVEAVSSP